MKTLAPFLTSLVVAVWVIAIAIISVQNATPVSLKFLTFQSIQIPMGLVLAFSACAGLIGMALLQPLWGLAGIGQGNSRLEDDAEFFVDDEDF
ncbi:LapA family protein [Nostoc sp. UHCC 0252]|uniref:LapA family protein n=1 Tax=Nostoc sp. UHCC 0252 TaxID=3110241 RepID=UPI002B1FC1B3|nr:LapA family protein [Nostoc sp. UHCC 0252]MEA5601436.1 LapA family protein [Nostoc sp. UHCC 0252]